MSENTTLKHPTIDGVTQEVASKDVAAWKKAGWLEDGKSAAKAAESEKDAAK